MVEALVVELMIILILILANGFFAASELAVVSARKGRLEQLAADGRQGATVALELAESPDRFLSTVQVGITLIGTFAAAFGGASLAEVLEGALASSPTLAPYASSIALVVVVLGISYLSLILGELVPKRLALQNAEGMASFVAPAMRLISHLAAPIVWFLTVSTELVLRLLGRHNVPEAPITEDDVLALVREGAEEGTLEAAEETFINNIFSFTDRTVRSLLTPRTQIVAVAVDTPFREALRVVTDSGFSRIPVYEGTLDRIVGLLYVKDLLQAWGRPEPIDLRALLRAPMYLLESQRAVVAFQLLKQHRSAVAMVLDEYGQIAGLISMADILEEVVGDIPDEYDTADEAIVRRDDGSYLVDGLVPFADLQELLHLPPLDEEARPRDFETIAGFVLALLGHIPAVGEYVSWHGYTFEVVDMDQRRIDKVLVHPPRTGAGARMSGIPTSGAVLPPRTSREGHGPEPHDGERG